MSLGVAFGQFGVARAECAKVVLGFGRFVSEAAKRFQFPLPDQVLDDFGVVAAGVDAEALGDDRKVFE